jgi:hypothetical protein
LFILALVEFLALYMATLGAQMWSGPGDLFKICSSTAVLLIVYFALRAANREYAPGRFKPLEHWLRDGGQSAGVVAEGPVGVSRRAYRLPAAHLRALADMGGRHRASRR